MEFPEELRYTKEHEWARLDGDRVTVGITDFAQEELGDVVYVELPQIGRTVETSGTFGVVESVKAASDVYAPLAGEVTGSNDALADSPETVNQDPFGAGWLMKLKPANPADLDQLMDAAAYEAHVAAEDH